ncbi:hypothetical protein BH10PSE7_BH10PSE7_08320 [soil metagenome]
MQRSTQGDATVATVNLDSGDDTFSTSGLSLETRVFGGAGDDQIGIGNTSTVNGGAGNDRIGLTIFIPFIGTSGATIDGGTGADFIAVGDSIFNVRFENQAGGVLGMLSLSNGSTAKVSNVEAFGFDDLTITASSLLAGKIASGGNGDDTIGGTAKSDFLGGENGDDKLSGGGGNDVLAGAAGNDTAAGSSGDDALGGGDGKDVLKGDAGDDVIEGGADNDVMSGGAGSDLFRFSHFQPFGKDTISDFTAGPDSGDVLSFATGDGPYDTVGELLASAKQSGNNTILTLSGGFEQPNSTITLLGVDKADLTVSDFAVF